MYWRDSDISKITSTNINAAHEQHPDTPAAPKELSSRNQHEVNVSKLECAAGRNQNASHHVLAGFGDMTKHCSAKYWRDSEISDENHCADDSHVKLWVPNARGDGVETRVRGCDDESLRPFRHGNSAKIQAVGAHHA